MHCTKCGVELAEGSAFCHRCGHPASGAPSDGDVSSGHGIANLSSDSQADQPAIFGKMPAIDRNAGEPEQKLWQGGYSPKAMIPSWCVAGALALLIFVGTLAFGGSFAVWMVVLLVILVIFAIPAIQLGYRLLSVHYELTSERFVHRSGILWQRTDRIEVIDMDDIAFEQGIVERVLGVGTIKVLSSDRSHPQIRLRGIDKVSEVSMLMDNARRKERLRRGIHIEAV